MNSIWRICFAWISLLCVAFFFVWSWVAADLEKINQMETSYVRKQALLSRLQALPKEEQAIRARLEKLSRDALARQLYDGNANSVQSLIQRDLRQLAAESQVTINSVRALSELRQSGPLKHTSIQLNMVATHERLVGFLQELEAWEPLLRTTRLTVRVRTPSTDVSPAGLAVLMEVTGYRRASNTGGRVD